jgi:CHAT domain-containing protein
VSQIANEDELLIRLHKCFGVKVEPLLHLLHGVTNLIVVPTGSDLHGIPIEPLRVRLEGDEYLMDVYSISYSQSVASSAPLMHQNAQEILRMKALVLSAFDTLGTAFARIPASAIEARSIATHFRDHTLLVGPDCSEENVRSSLSCSKYGVVHVAAHASVDSSMPVASAIQLSRNPGSEHDGILKFEELVDLGVNPDLVVLSTCKSGVGPHRYQKGHYGLAQAFSQQESTAIVVSCWQADDIATAMLMEQFYSHMRGKPLADALSCAKRELRETTIRELAEWCEVNELGECAQIAHRRAAAVGSGSPAFEHPYYWSAFVLIR